MTGFQPGRSAAVLVVDAAAPRSARRRRGRVMRLGDHDGGGGGASGACTPTGSAGSEEARGAATVDLSRPQGVLATARHVTGRGGPCPGSVSGTSTACPAAVPRLPSLDEGCCSGCVDIGSTLPKPSCCGSPTVPPSVHLVKRVRCPLAWQIFGGFLAD